MLKQIKNAWLFSKNRFLTTVFVVLVFAVLSCACTLLIVKVFGKYDTEITYIHLMSLIPYIVLWMMILLSSMTDFGKTFDMMIGMGRTRKEFFISYGVVNFATYLGYAGLIVFIAWMETVLEKIFYAGIPNEMNLTEFFFDARTIVLTVLIGFIYNMLMGALYLKFRQKIFMLVWVLFMFMGLIMQMIGKAIEAHTAWVMAVINFFVTIFTAPAVVLIWGAVAVTILLVAVSYLLVRKREIVVW